MASSRTVYKQDPTVLLNQEPSEQEHHGKSQAEIREQIPSSAPGSVQGGAPSGEASAIKGAPRSTQYQLMLGTLQWNIPHHTDAQLARLQPARAPRQV